MSINHKKYTLVIVDEYSRYTWVQFLRKKHQAAEIIMSFIRMVENQNDVKVKQIRTDSGTEFRNHKLESFYDEKGISQNFYSPYTPEQNGTEAVRVACYTQNRSVTVKIHDKTPYEIFREIILDISYFHMFGYPVFIHNHKDHLGKFDAKADDGYFLGYSFFSKAFRAYNTRRQQIKETCHVTFNESMKSIRFTNTSVDEIGIDDSFRYPPDEFLYDDDPSRQYQVNSNISYYVIPHGLPDVSQSHITNQASTSFHHVLRTDDQENNPLRPSTGLPSTLDEGTRKSKPLPEGTVTHPKDSRENVQPLDRDLTFTTSDDGMAKTKPHPEESLGDKDLGGNIPPIDIELINPNVADLLGTGAKYQEDQTQSSRLMYQSLTKNKESEEDILGASEETNDNPQSAKTPQSTETQHQSSPP
ncbi:retrovirus-related pol polyprotein from transposon TNT 1-94 [Tanacetum coccineum]